MIGAAKPTNVEQEDEKVNQRVSSQLKWSERIICAKSWKGAVLAIGPRIRLNSNTCVRSATSPASAERN